MNEHSRYLTSVVKKRQYSDLYDRTISARVTKKKLKYVMTKIFNKIMVMHANGILPLLSQRMIV